MSEIKRADAEVIYLAFVTALILIIGAVLIWGPNNIANISLSILYLFLGALITLIFSLIQDTKKGKQDTARIIDEYRTALISASVVCFDNLASINVNQKQFESLNKAVSEGRYFSTSILDYKQIDPKNLINNSLFSSITACNRVLITVSFNDKLVEKINTEMSQLAHSIHISGKQLSEKVISHDRETIKEATQSVINSLKSRRNTVEKMLNEINLHIKNLDYKFYVKNPNEMIRKTLFYKPTKSEIDKLLNETKEQIVAINGSYKYNEIIKDI